MPAAAATAHWTVRVSGLVMIILGIAIWTGSFDALIPVHSLVGLILVLALWTLAYYARRSGVSSGLVVLTILWGLLLPILGLTQHQLLVGNAHWVVQVVHLVAGLVAIGLGEMLAAAMLRLGRGAASA